MLHNTSFREIVQNNSNYDYEDLEEEVTRDIFSDKQMVEFEDIINSSNKKYLNDFSDMQLIHKQNITEADEMYGTFKNYKRENSLTHHNDSFKFKQKEDSIHSKRSSLSKSRNGIPKEKVSVTNNTNIRESSRSNKKIEKLKKLEKEAEEKFRNECSFKPKINKYKVEKLEGETRKEAIERLAQPRINELNQRTIDKENMELQKINKVCTFHPKISDNSRIILQDKSYCSEDNTREIELVEDRLLRVASQMKEKRDKFRKNFQEHKISEHSFVPNINENSKILAKRIECSPLHERYNEVLRLKEENLNKLRMNKINSERNLNLFKPELNQKSEEIILNMSQDNYEKNAHYRLYNHAIEKRNRKSDQNKSNEECTFIPRCNYTTNSPIGNIEDFLGRQKTYQELRKEKHNRLLTPTKQDLTFTPKINLNSKVLVEANTERARETTLDAKVERLYKQQYESIKKKKAILEKNIYSRYTFQPKINENSAYLKRSKSRDITKSKEKHNIIKKEEEENCSFKPNINKNNKYYENVNSNYKFDENITERIKTELKQKEEKIGEIKNYLSYKEQREHVFHPEIKKELPNFEFKEPILLKGFAKHLQQMENARNAKREKEEREKKAFVNGDNWSRDQVFTTPKPFKLSYQTVDENKKKAEILRKKDEYELKECSFKPKINPAKLRKNQDVIRMILDD